MDKSYLLSANFLAVISTTIFCQAAWASGNEQAETNAVTREIRSDGNTVLVRDTIHLDTGLWAVKSGLRNVYQSKKQGVTDMLPIVKAFLSDEDLEILECAATISEPFMDVHILSRLKAKRLEPAKIHFLPTYVGYRYKFPISGVVSEPYLLVYEGRGFKLLWMPEWDAPEHLGATLTNVLNSTFLERQMMGQEKNALTFKCVLKRGNAEETLFEANPWAASPSAPDLGSLSKIHQLHKMTGNDWRRIFTDVKPAKSGYYVIDASGFTNSPPLLPPGEVKISTQPMSTAEVNRFISELKGSESRRFPKQSIAIDGLFMDWKNYKTAWSDGTKQADDDHYFKVNECNYSNDDECLYLFLKFSPDIEYRFKRLNPDGRFRSLGNIGFLYLRSKNSADRGALVSEVQPELVGADTMVSVLFGTRVSEGSAKPSVSYKVSSWDSSARTFYGSPRPSESSSGSQPLINYGKDGVEMAIPLSDLHRTKGDKFELIFGGGIPDGRYRVVPVSIE